MKLSIQEGFLALGGVIAGMVATWHLLMIIGGPSWYAFARAPEYIIESAKMGTFVAPVMAVGIAILMYTCTLYSFSGAGLIRKIPLLKSALVTISLICLARAALVSPLFYPLNILGTWHMVASSGWLFVGLCFLGGAVNKLTRKSGKY